MVKLAVQHCTVQCDSKGRVLIRGGGGELLGPGNFAQLSELLCVNLEMLARVSGSICQTVFRLGKIVRQSTTEIC